MLEEFASIAKRVQDLAEREDRAVESILENERLTADLDDAAAQVLLDWGVACAKRIARSTAALAVEEAQDAMTPRLRATRLLMRHVNRIIANQGEIEPGRRAVLLSRIVDQASTIYGERYTPPDTALLEAFSRKRFEHVGDPAHLIAELRELIEGTPDMPAPKRELNTPSTTERRSQTRRKRPDSWNHEIPN